MGELEPDIQCRQMEKAMHTADIPHVFLQKDLFLQMVDSGH